MSTESLMISMSRSFTRIALPYSLLVFRSTNKPILLPGTPTPKNKYTREAFSPSAGGPADYCHDRKGGQERSLNHRFAILASFYISSPFPLELQVQRFLHFNFTTRRWILASVEHSLSKNCKFLHHFYATICAMSNPTL